MPNNLEARNLSENYFVIDRRNCLFASAISFLPVNPFLSLKPFTNYNQHEMEVPESGLSTSSAASEVIDSKNEADQIAEEGAGSNGEAQSPDVEQNKVEKKSFRFKLTVFMLCFISVVVAMVSPISLGAKFFSLLRFISSLGVSWEKEVYRPPFQLSFEPFF